MILEIVMIWFIIAKYSIVIINSLIKKCAEGMDFKMLVRVKYKVEGHGSNWTVLTTGSTVMLYNLCMKLNGPKG